jgi:uncharacterized membrane protein
MKQKNRKAQAGMGGMPFAIMTIVVAIIVLVMGLVIIQEIRDADVVDQGASSSFANELLTTVTEVGDNLACYTYFASSCSVSAVTNTTSGGTINSGNYTVTDCTLFSTGSPDYNNSNWNVTYSCTHGDTAFTAGNSSLVGLGDFADFIPIIVIALAASIIIGLILIGFAFRRRVR